MDRDEITQIIDLGDATILTRQFSEGEDDGSPTSPGLNLVYPNKSEPDPGIYD